MKERKADADKELLNTMTEEMSEFNFHLAGEYTFILISNELIKDSSNELTNEDSTIIIEKSE